MSLEKGDIVLQCVVAVLLATVSFLFFQFVIPYHLFFKEQLQLFLYTSDYFLSYLDKPAWLSRCIGDFFTQFLYLRGGGALVVTLILLTEWLLITRLLRLFGSGRITPLWALFPVIMEWIGYGNPYFTLSFSFAFILVLLFFLLYATIRNRWLSGFLGLLCIPLLYSFTGAFIFVFSLLVFLYELHTRQRRGLFVLLILILTAIYPLCVRHFYLLTIQQAYFFPLPQISFALPAFTFLLFVFILQIRKIRTSRMTARSFTLNNLFVVFLLVGGLFFTTDLNRERILAMSSEAYFGNWEKVCRIAEKHRIPNTQATYYTNIALSQYKQLPEQLLNYYQPASQGLFLPVTPETDWLTIFFSNDAFFHVGDMTMAEHSAMLGMIFSPNQRSSRMVMRLAEINLVNGDSTATRKYLRMLEATLYHKKKARRLEEMLLADNVDDYPWLQQKQAQLFTRDTLRHNDDYPAALELLVESNPENRQALDYLLCYYLLHKDVSSFFAAYNKYVGKRTETPIPRVYEEGLLVYLAATKANQKQIDSYSFNPETIQEFAEYNRLYQESEENPGAVQENYATTYWMYYHFAQWKE